MNVRDGDEQIQNGGPAHTMWYIPSPEMLKEAFDLSMSQTTPEQGADEHFARHLRGDVPLPPYDGSRRRRRPWRKAIDVSHLHCCTCPSCGQRSYCGDWQHHVYVTDLERCRCQPVGSLPDRHIRCPQGCLGCQWKSEPEPEDECQERPGEP
jgi:hypothetical protein